jgi:tellurite resistance protein
VTSLLLHDEFQELIGRDKMMTPMQKVDVLRAACCVAGCDGEITDTERNLIQKLAGDVGVGKASVEAMIDRGLRDPEFHQEQFRVLKSDPKDSLAALLEVAMADGSIGDGETRVLKAISEKLEVAPEVFEQLMIDVSKLLD